MLGLNQKVFEVAQKKKTHPQITKTMNRKTGTTMEGINPTIPTITLNISGLNTQMRNC